MMKNGKKIFFVMYYDHLLKLLSSTFFSEGAHGYDPEKVQEMRPFFLAYGPSFKSNFTHTHPINIVDIYPLMCEILSVEAAPNNGTLSEVKELLITPPAEKLSLSNLKEKLFETTGITCKLPYKTHVQVGCNSHENFMVEHLYNLTFRKGLCLTVVI